MIATKKAVKSAARPTAQPPEKCQDVEAEIERIRKASLVRAREMLRVKILPQLECAILAVPSGNVRNSMTDANVTLLKVLEQLGA